MKEESYIDVMFAKTASRSASIQPYCVSPNWIGNGDERWPIVSVQEVKTIAIT